MISIIIPAFNVEKYIIKCFESIIEQEYKDIEIIFIDDGSSDLTYYKAKDFLEKNLFFKYKIIKQKNLGVSIARNKGIEAAEGEYILFLDADDYLEKSVLKKCVEKLKLTNSDICFYGWKEISESKQEIVSLYSDNFNFIKSELDGISACINKISKNIWICTGNAIYKSDILEDNSIKYSEKLSYGEDLEFINKCLINSKKVTCVEMNGLCCVIREGSATQSKFNFKFLDALITNRNFRNYIKCKNIINKNKQELLLLIDNDYDNIVGNICSRLIEDKGIISSHKFLKENKIKLKSESKLIIKNISEKEKIFYKIFYRNKLIALCYLKILKSLRKLKKNNY